MLLRLLLIPFFLFALTLDTGCGFPNRGDEEVNVDTDDEDGPTSGGEDDDGKEVPGGGDDDSADNGGSDDNDDSSGDDDEPVDDADLDIRTETGALRSGDQTLTSGEFADLYSVDVEEGQTITVEMTSSNFDPYLILRVPGGTQVDNDDYNGDRTLSRIDHVAAADGEFDVIATSYAPGETGDYEVEISVGEGRRGGSSGGSSGGNSGGSGK